MPPKMGKRARRTAIALVTGRPAKRQGRKPNQADKVIFLPRGVSKAFPMPGVYETRFSSTIFGYTTSSTGSGDYSWNFSLNNLYRPWNTGYTTGLTPSVVSFSTLAPAYFSTMCSSALYQNFRVLDSLISVDLMPQSVVDGVTCSILATNNAGPLVSSVMNQRGAKTMDFLSGRTPRNPGGLVARTTVSKFLGSNVKNDLSYNYCGTYNSAPAKQLYWLVAVETPDNSTLSQPLEVRIRIEWRCELFALQGINAPLTLALPVLDPVDSKLDFDNISSLHEDESEDKHEVLVHPPSSKYLASSKEKRPLKQDVKSLTEAMTLL